MAIFDVRRPTNDGIIVQGTGLDPGQFYYFYGIIPQLKGIGLKINERILNKPIYLR